MAEDWHAIAAEVEDALKSVAQTDAGYPVVIRRMVEGVPPNGFTSGVQTPVYEQAYAIQDTRKIRNAEGNLIDNPETVVTISAVGITPPTANDHIALGVVVGNAELVVDWLYIKQVIPLSPVGIPVLFDIVLGS